MICGIFDDKVLVVFCLIFGDILHDGFGYFYIKFDSDKGEVDDNGETCRSFSFKSLGKVINKELSEILKDSEIQNNELSEVLENTKFNVGEEFRNEIIRNKSETSKKKKLIRSGIYDRMEKNLKGRTRSAIKVRLTRAECVYKLFKGIGGKQKINRMRNTCMNTIIELKIKEGEIDELIRRVNEIEEERNNIEM
ncbi:hypothetical protein C1646_762522 [Rhizophagus diaphanus]|nr:hypothetical protein C1646_762522 [Rhizophagus diaphanus] [Rhizophagus sp. MUCL 43196]